MRVSFSLLSRSKLNDIYYCSLSEAHAAAHNDDILLAKGTDYYEDLVFDRTVSFSFKGGRYDDYATTSGTTLVHGTVVISSGTVNIDGLTIMP